MTTQPDPTIRERLRELAEKATQGPWKFWDKRGRAFWDKPKGIGGRIVGHSGPDDYGVIANGVNFSPLTIEDAALIVEAVNALPLLLDELDTLERQVRAAEVVIDVAIRLTEFIQNDMGTWTVIEQRADESNELTATPVADYQQMLALHDELQAALSDASSLITRE